MGPEQDARVGLEWQGEDHPPSEVGGSNWFPVLFFGNFFYLRASLSKL